MTPDLKEYKDIYFFLGKIMDLVIQGQKRILPVAFSREEQRTTTAVSLNILASVLLPPFPHSYEEDKEKETRDKQLSRLANHLG